MLMRRTIRIKDKYNDHKEWEITAKDNGFYLRQFIDGKQIGERMRVPKGFIEYNLGIRIVYNIVEGIKILNL